MICAHRNIIRIIKSRRMSGAVALSTHCVGGWVGPGASVHILTKTVTFYLCSELNLGLSGHKCRDCTT
jgi:hypothetical protein